MKKISLILLALGIVSIIIPLAFPSMISDEKSNNQNDNNKVTWSILSGKNIIIDDPGYNTENFSTAYFNSIFTSANKYWFNVPTDNQLTKVGNDEYKYAGSVSVDYGLNTFTNVKDHFISYAREYETDNIYIAKREINDKSFAINIKANDAINSNYSEELLILYEEEKNNYSYVRYKIDNRCFSEAFIEKIISEFKVENNKSTYTTCKEENGQYNCEFKVDSIDKKINFKVDSTAYNLETDSQYENYTEKFAVVDSNSQDIEVGRISISLNISDVLNIMVDNYYSNLQYNKKELNANGIKIDKYYYGNGVSENNDQVAYSANYIIYLDDSIAMNISIMSGKDNLDEIIKDFTDFKLTDM